MATVAQRTTPIKHYASYLVHGQEVYGTAELVCGSGYLFRQDGQRTATLVSYKDSDLILNGLVALADAQWQQDQAHGDLAALAGAR
jgi:hypothetical protein